MINENFKPAEWKYVETPYAEMLKHGMAQQANYDEAINAMAEYDAKLGALKRIDEDTYQSVVSKYDQDFRDMYDQYGGDWGAMKNKVKQRLGAETVNPYYNLNRAHVEKYEKEQALKEQIKANGGSTLTFDEVPLSLVGQNGRLINVKDITSNIEKMQDYNEAITRDWKNVLNPESHGYETGLDQLNEGNLAKLGNKAYLQFVKTVTSGISSGQIDKKEAAVLGSYLNSEVGMQHVRALTKSKELGGGGRSEEEAIRIIADQVNRTGHSMEYMSTDQSTQVQANSFYNPKNNPGGGKKADSLNDLATHIGEDINTMPMNESERALDAANRFTKDKSNWEKKLKETEEKIKQLNDELQDNTAKGFAARDAKQEIDKTFSKLNKEKQEYIKQIKANENAIIYHRTQALKTNSRISDFAKAIGYKINVNDVNSVNKFWNDPIVINTYNRYMNDRSSYLNTEVVIANPQFTDVTTKHLLTSPTRALVDKDGKLIDFDIKPGTSPIYEFINGSNKIKITYAPTGEKTPVTRYVVKSKLPQAVSNRMKELDGLTNAMNSSQDGIKIKLGPNEYTSLTGIKYQILTGSNKAPDGAPVNPMGTYFVDQNNNYWTANTLRGVGFNDIEFSGSQTHKSESGNVNNQLPLNIEEEYDPTAGL